MSISFFMGGVELIDTESKAWNVAGKMLYHWAVYPVLLHFQNKWRKLDFECFYLKKW